MLRDKMPAKEGQHFMMDEALLKRIVSYARIEPSEKILEVGAGRGALTELLPGKVTAIEKDPSLFRELEERFKENPDIALILGDALKAEFPDFDKFVANIPYQISKPLLLKLLQQDFKEAVLVTQLEFAQKAAAKPGEKNYGLLSAFLHSQAETELLERVPKNAFAPQPKVESAVLKIRRIHPPLDPHYLDFLKRLFTQKRKTLRRLIPASEELASKRIIELTPEELLILYNDS
jgi:16S rRNA (adenine1518-N6/adenine1519-N6)-dimethyltransferase